jgi:hypothetical protein
MLDERKFNAELKRLAMASIREREDWRNFWTGIGAALFISTAFWAPAICLLVLWLQGRL